jgi:S-adenosylmethionine-diacylgycerolhomoserine-N-methlytransferase
MATDIIVSEDQTKRSMYDMYRWTRHIYDLTRKYYLLGRDELIKHLDAKNGETVCEIGCGTARNLIKMAQRYRKADFYGLDASEEMLKTAAGNLERAGLLRDIPLKQSYSQSFDPKDLFGLEKPLDKMVFSYALSIIPPWQESIDHALTLLPSGGEIHIVDFAGQDDLPAFFRKFLFWWLQKFHVFYKPEIEAYLRRLEIEKQGTLEFHSLYKGYAYRAIFRKA